MLFEVLKLKTLLLSLVFLLCNRLSPFLSDINECAVRNPCLYEGQCRNTDGDYFCICPQGRTGKICEQSTYLVQSSVDFFLCWRVCHRALNSHFYKREMLENKHLFKRHSNNNCSKFLFLYGQFCHDQWHIKDLTLGGGRARTLSRGGG